MRWLVRAALLLVPVSWRETVHADLEEEARLAGRTGVAGSLWRTWQALRLAVPLRWTFSGDAVMSDIRHAIRSLLRARWFTVGAIATFALGIGVNVAVFSAVDRMLFRPMPYPNASRLFLLQEADRATGETYGTLPASWLVDARRNVKGIADLAVGDLFARGFAISSEPGSPTVSLTSATFNILTVCGVTPMVGRGFVEADAREHRSLVLLSYEAWQAQFGGRSDILKVTLWQANAPFEIIGVLPKGFIPPGSNLIARWHGLVLDDELIQTAKPTDRSSAGIVLLAPGQTPQAIESALTPIVEDWMRQQPPPPPGRVATPVVATLAPVRDVMFHFYQPYLRLVSVAAALVLLMACANLASLLIVRGRSRERYAAIQVSLGASPIRLVRTALAESAILAFLGGAVGIGVLAWSNQALRALLPPLFSGYAAPLTDGRVVVFSLGVAALCALVSGLAPALRSTRVDVLSVLQQTGGRGRSGRLRGGASLLVVEAAIGVTLVAGAAMTTRSLIGLMRTDVGFEPRGLLNVNVTYPFDAKEEGANRLARGKRTLELLRQSPGVIRAGAAEIMPIMGAAGRAFGKGFEGKGQRWQVTDGFFETMGMRVIAGRTMTAAEVDSQADVAVLSELGLALVSPGTSAANAVGQFVRFDGEAPRQIVGVVSDVLGGYAAKAAPSIYVPITDDARRLMFVARTEGTPLDPVALRARVQAAIATPQTVGVGEELDTLTGGLRDDRFRTALFGAFGVLGLVLAAVGLYAVTSFETTLRHLEMGVRLALGATPGQVKRLIIQDAIRPVAIGIVIGLGASYWAAKFLQVFLHGVDARDPWTLAIVGATLGTAAVVAAWLPARRASHTDPAATLRAQ